MLRYATLDDVELITSQRHRMFADNGFGSQAALDAADAEFRPWVRARLADGRYIGLLLEQDGAVVAGAGIYFADFPPHWKAAQPLRAYVLNVFTEPGWRGQGLARQLMDEVLAECRRRRVRTVVLHASPQGRPVYEKLGFAPTDEMMLLLD